MSTRGRMDRGIRSRLHLTTYEDEGVELAKRHGLGLELLEFSTAAHLDGHAAWHSKVRQRTQCIHRLALHGPFHDLAPGTIDPEIRRVTAARFGQAYELAGMYGAGRIVYHSGYIPRAYPEAAWVSNSAAFWRSFLADLGDKPERPLVLIENVADEHPGLLMEIVDAVGDPRLRICLDIGHANLNSALPLREWITALGERTGHVHLHNNDGLHDRHWRLDQGNINMRETLDLLAEYSPDATMTLECAEEERSLQWLAEQGFLG